mgnify:CR=1 FL=1
MEPNELLAKKKLSNINKKSNIELMRTELFSIATIILLSEYYFPKNDDIKPLLDKLNLSFSHKDYIFKNRALILGKVLREIKKADKDKLFNIFDSFKYLVFYHEKVKDENIKKSKPSKENYIDDLLNSFTRNRDV